MRKLKTFDELHEGRFFRGITKTTLTINSILRTIFSLFKSKNELKKIWKDNKSLKIATDVYDALVDLEQISKLSEEDIEKYASNIEATDNKKFLSLIIQHNYKEKHNRDFFKDLNNTIKNLEKIIEDEKDDEYFNNMGNYELCKEFLRQIKELKKELKN